MHSVISFVHKVGKTRRFVFNQACDRVEGWWAGKARLRASREKNMLNEINKEWDIFYKRFTELHGYIINRMHKKIDYAKMDPNSKACLPDKQYWEGWNAGLDWAHRIVDGDKSAD
jgi:hypothetical protein